MRRLAFNIGSGKDFRESTQEMEWMNFDKDPSVRADGRGDIGILDLYWTNAADVIVANDILEHIPYSENDKKSWRGVLASWVACLKPGGTIRVQVPDPGAIFAQYVGGNIDESTMNRVIYGESTTEWDKHYQLISKERLEATMKEMGLEIIESYNLHVCAIVVGRRNA